MSHSKRWIIAISGASGVRYGQRLIEALCQHDSEIELEVVISQGALRVFRDEETWPASVGKLNAEAIIGAYSERVTVHSNRNTGASIASGSYPVAGMAIVPCSMKTLSAVACGYADNLIQRAADVCIKENRPLVLVPRETPLSVIHLENLLKLARIGVRVVPAMPGFYQDPKSIEDLVDSMVMKIADQMGIQLDLLARWGEAGSLERKGQKKVYV